MRAAIYCRVSTEDQGKEGSSLQSQRGTCMGLAQSQGFEVVQIFEEMYSGLSMERPAMDNLRKLVRAREIDKLIVYALDRLSRNPVHIIILQEELERNHVDLMLVTEPVDSSALGKLVTYVKGYAAQLEAEKIKERTVRGKQTKAAMGKIVSGSHARLYGYTYITAKQENGSRRVINDDEAAQIRQMFDWLVNEHLSINGITARLRTLRVPTPSGKGIWIRSTVRKILTNAAYTGKTYAFTVTYGEPAFKIKPVTKRKKTGRIIQPRENWIEIPGVTPAIISEELFSAAQAQLTHNKEMSRRNSHEEYLLHGRVYCQRCSRAFWGHVHTDRRGEKVYRWREYKCSGKYKIVSPVTCSNPAQNADKLEALVWGQIEQLLSKPETVIAEMFKRQREVIEGKTRLVGELADMDVKLTALYREEEHLVDLFMMNFDENLTRIEKAKIDAKRKLLQEQKANIEKRIEAQKNSIIDLRRIEQFCTAIRENMGRLSFADKMSILDSLKVKILVDGNDISLSGCIPLSSVSIEDTVSGLHDHNRHADFTFTLTINNKAYFEV